jgi:hypothetical protein
LDIAESAIRGFLGNSTTQDQHQQCIEDGSFEIAAAKTDERKIHSCTHAIIPNILTYAWRFDKHALPEFYRLPTLERFLKDN